MPARSAQNVSLTPELQKLIADKVASGHYRSASEVVRAALRHFAGADDPTKVTGVGVDPETELVTILEGIGEGFYALDRDFRITRYNSACTKHFGKAPQEVLGRVLWDVFPSATGTELGRKFAETMKSRARVTGETESVLIANRWLVYRLFPLGDGMGIVFNDVTDRKSAEDHRELLIHELNHRVKNTLATVQSLAAQTLRNGGVDPSVQETLEARLMTLSNVHSLLTNENWESAELRDVVWASLRPHTAPDRAPFAVAGPDLRLRPKSAVIVSMALHELSTNAIKYGALSVDTGRINLDWAIANGRFNLRWQESGGPPVVMPSRTGFGSRLIERGLSAELRGSAAIDYRASGVVCTIDAPVEAVRDTDLP
jgi:PAS domain S-box-containing protein